MRLVASVDAYLRRPVRFSVVLALAVAVGALSALPYVAKTMHPSYRGLMVIRDKDFANYMSRLERALLGHPNEAGNGITPVGSGIEGMQVAGVEEVLGRLLGWTGLDAPVLSVVVTAVLAPLLFLLLFALFRRLEFPGRAALAMTAILFAVMFHVLTRIVHPGWSFVPAIAALLSFFLFHERPGFPRAIAAGVLLGLLPFLYFWSWTFTWAVCGSYALLSILADGRRSAFLARWHETVVLGLTVCIVSFPFFLYSFLLFRNPIYGEVAVRASFLYERTPESWPRSILLLVVTGAFLSLWRSEHRKPGYLGVGALLLGILLAMHQNILHAKILMFSSHFYPHLLIAATAAGAWAVIHRIPVIRRLLIAGVSALFLAAGAWDYLDGHRFFVPRASDFRHQHLLEPVRMLKNKEPPASAKATAGKRDVVLTDADTGRVLTAWTDDGIVYTHHVRFLLISDRDMAERFCVSELFNPVPDPFRSVYIEYNHVLDSPAMRAREKSLVEDACNTVRRHPREYLQKYGVTHILWNAKDYPLWRIEGQAERLGFREQGSGSGWVIWGRNGY